MKKYLFFCFFACLFLSSCNSGKQPGQQTAADQVIAPAGYSADRSFLQKYVSVLELKSGDSRVLLVPQYQGRVMTSSCDGDFGYSFGWINYDLIKSGKLMEHINPYGGEERFWVAPEGGQFSLYFKEKVPYDFEHWFTPLVFDTASFDISNHTDTSVDFTKNFQLNNRFGTRFSIHIDRKIRLLPATAISDRLGLTPDSSIHAVAYSSENTLENTGKKAWTKVSGAPAVWLLGMLKPSLQTTIVLPLKSNPGDTSAWVHDTYFGKIPGDRWKISGDHAFLKADGKFRGKVGIPPNHTNKYIGSYDAGKNILTILEALWPAGAKDFVNSAWEDQKDPFSGDAFNAYNDGPLANGTQLGPFYEIESLSPAAFLEPGKSLTHTQITYHFQGNEHSLNTIAEKVLGISLTDIKQVFQIPAHYDD